jgi:hypothetical protein
MAITGTVQQISQIGDSPRVSVQILFSGGTIKEYQFDLPLDQAAAVVAIKEDIAKLNSIAGQVQSLQTLIGAVIS